MYSVGYTGTGKTGVFGGHTEHTELSSGVGIKSVPSHAGVFGMVFEAVPNVTDIFRYGIYLENTPGIPWYVPNGTHPCTVMRLLNLTWGCSCLDLKPTYRAVLSGDDYFKIFLFCEFCIKIRRRSVANCEF